MTKELANLFSTRSEVYGDINTTIAQINDKNYNNLPFDVTTKLEELNKTEAFAQRDKNAAPLSRPLYPIVQISRYFGDSDFADKYKIPFNGIEIPAEQNSPLYAVDEGLIYKIANKDGI
jgi:murein DD-endopeptidase MepM/ murein hydrolase activator NlpD